MFSRFIKNRAALISLIFLILVSILAIFAPWVAPYSFEAQNIADQLQGPSLTHLMGTDTLGRDIFSRVLFGARVSLAVGLSTALFALIFGTICGALAGYFGGWIDSVLMRIVDIFYILPSLLLAILFMILLGRGISGIVLALGMTAWITQARLVRAQVMQVREMTYVEAARASGAHSIRILWQHILPNIMGPVLISLSFQIPTNIMSESFLSFIGLGVQPPHATWGTLASDGFRAMKSYPHLILFPGTVLFLTLLAFNYLGDGLRDSLDPRLKRDFNT